jgi:hypothetical protein
MKFKAIALAMTSYFPRHLHSRKGGPNGTAGGPTSPEWNRTFHEQGYARRARL